MKATIEMIRLEKALETGNLEYVGEKDFLEDVIEAFDMGIESQTEQKYNYIHGKYGMKFMLALFITIMISNLAANYISFSIISPITLVIFSSIAFWKYKKINYFSTFEYFTIGIYFVLTVFGILSLSGVFSQSIDYIFESKYILLIFAVYLLSTWFINKPTTFGFFRYDYRTDYTKTKLFQKSCGGVTFIWGIIFFTISLLSFIVPNNYAALSYYIVIFGIFFTYFYPRYYVESNIDN